MHSDFGERTEVVDRRPKGAEVMAGCGKNAEIVRDIWIQKAAVSGERG
jgi:hypothetical protein